MGKYLITYSGGAQPDDMTQEQREQVMKAWMDWYASLGDSVVDMGDPTGASKVVAPSGGVSDGSSGITGYSLINAESLDAAAEACKSHPHLAAGGRIDIHETFNVM